MSEVYFRVSTNVPFAIKEQFHRWYFLMFLFSSLKFLFTELNFYAIWIVHIFGFYLWLNIQRSIEDKVFVITGMYTANVYSQSADKLIFFSVDSTQ